MSMKKLYFLFSIVFLSLSFVSKAQLPTCSYDMAWLATGREGIFPDSATNFISGNVGSPYVQNLTIKIPNDTTVPGFGTVHFAHVDLKRNITSPSNYGLPPGLSIGTSASNVQITTNAYKFPGNDTSCMSIYGTPTTAGTYTLSFTLDTYVSELPFSAINTQTLTYYKITINPAVGLADNVASKFEVSNPVPNPSSTSSSIKYSLPKNGAAKLSVYNTIGKLVYAKKAEGKQGENEFEVNASELASGMYIYSVEFDGKTITKRMIVSKD